MSLDENLVVENLNELLTNSVTLTSKYYDIFINPDPMDVTLWMYNDQNELIEVTIPNRAKDRQDSIVNNGVLTILKNGLSLGTFSANSSVDKAISIPVPTKTSELVNDAGFVRDTDIPVVGDGRVTISQGGEVKGSFTTNQSANAVIDLETTVNIDRSSITFNSEDKIQTVGVIDNNSGDTTKVWTGTRQQYDAITVKDNNTIYNVTDDVSIVDSLLDTLYPIGSIYIGTMSVCPLQLLGVGTWSLIAADRVLQGSGTYAAGSTVEAGLPNITGHFIGVDDNRTYPEYVTGAFYVDTNRTGTDGGDNVDAGIGFDASLSNPIYGNSTTVQPSAYVVNIWRRIS